MTESDVAPVRREFGALKGLKVLSLAHVVAGPLAGGLLADLGADVVHVEPPGVGDPARHMGFDRDGVFLWWKVSGRNKRSITLDLRKPEGAEVARELAAWADVVVSSVRPATLDRWGVGWSNLHEVNERLIMLQITGYGMSGPRRDEPGFGKVGEAMSGAVNITGMPGGPPLHSSFSHGDSVTGLMGAFGLMAALYRRDHDPGFSGELIDLALFEPLFRLIEWQVIAWDQLGFAPNRNGNRLVFAPAAVANVYETADGEWVTVTSATRTSVLNVVNLIGLPAEEFQTIAAQRAQSDLIDARMREWMLSQSTEDALAKMRRAEVVASRIFSVADMMEDETFRARENIVSVQDPELGEVKMQGVFPKLTQHPGEIWRSGPSLGQDNALVYKDWLRMSEDRYNALTEAGVI